MRGLFKGGAVLEAALLAGCAGTPPEPPRVAAALEADPVRLRREVLEVLEVLERGFYEHWGAVERSAAYARLRPEHGPELRRIAEANVEESLMALRVLDRLEPRERFDAEARAILYVSALKREVNFARWGILMERGLFPGVYGHELLCLGRSAAPYLRGLLGDRRRAPVFGAGSADRENVRRGDRVCDYAWVLLAAILGRPVAYDADPERRDAAIRRFDRELDRPAR